MFEVFGAFMDLYVFEKVGGCRWLMHDEMLGSFILLLGCPGCPGCVLRGKCGDPFFSL